MAIPFKGYLYSRMAALGRGTAFVTIHVFHDDPTTQDFMITNCSLRVATFNVSPGNPPTNKVRMCLCCDFGKERRLPKVLRKLELA